MKANQLATLLLRLLGIYILADTIPSLVSAFYDLRIFLTDSTGKLAFSYVIIFVTRIVIGLLLIGFSNVWGKKIASLNPVEENDSPINFRQIQTLAFAIAGVLIVASALPQLFTSILNLLRETSTDDTLLNPSWITNRRTIIESSIGEILKTAFGIWLFFGAEGFANFFSSMRKFGTPNPPPPQ